MGRIWGEEAKYTAWLRVELAVCEAYARRGRIPANALARIRQKSRVDVRRILEIQDRVKHEMIALLTSLEEQLGTDSRFVHIGLTANDVWDTALAVQLRDAADLLIIGQERLRAALGDLARRHKDTLIVGRTHGVHAEPTTFGLKVAVWYVEAGRNLERLRRAREVVAVGKLSGAVGNFAHVDPDVEEDVCRELGLEPDAAQAQSGAVRAHLWAEPCDQGERPGRARERGPVARAGHQPLVGRARDPARLDDPARLPPGPHRLHRRGARRGSRPHGREPRPELRPRLLPARAPQADRRRPGPAGRVRDRAAERDAGVAGASLVPRAAGRRAGGERKADARRVEGVLRSRLVPASRRCDLQTGRTPFLEPEE